jgi:antitoxin HicB
LRPVSEQYALSESVDAMALVLQDHIDRRLPIPKASDKKRGEHWVSLPALDVDKIGLYEATCMKGLRKSDSHGSLACTLPRLTVSWI